MLDHLKPGSEVDGFVVGEQIHSGGQGRVFSVAAVAPDRDPGFPMIMKTPRIGRGESSEGLLNFETEAMIMPALSGSHLPRFVAAGDITRIPYLVIERVEGEGLQHRLDAGPLPADEAARVGAAIADALHSLHQQDAIHLDLKPDNVILAPSGQATLIDFGLMHHARFPDLLDEEQRFAAGSAPYVSPEQLLGTRSDPRSDIFALGVVLYQMTTGELPFGVPQTMAGLRDRLWLVPIPPRVLVAVTPPWLQEIILRCLEPDVNDRYQSAAHVAFDLRNPVQVPLTTRANRMKGAGFFEQALRWWQDRRGELVGRLPNLAPAGKASVIMVAVDTSHPDDERHPELQRITAQLLSLSGEFRLICVSVIRSAPLVEGQGGTETESGLHLEHLVRLRHWVAPLRLPPQRLSVHVIESARPAATLLDFARLNHVDLMVLGAPGPSQRAMAWWRSVASGVAANAHCSVHLVRVPDRRFEAYASLSSRPLRAEANMRGAEK